MLIHRCYIIWGSSKRVGIPLAITSALGSLTSLIGAVLVGLRFGDSTVERNDFLGDVGEQIALAGAFTSLIVNICITLLTGALATSWPNLVGQPGIEDISWSSVGQQASTHDENNVCSLSIGNNTDAKLVYLPSVESGLMYPTVMVAQLVNANIGSDDTPLAVDIGPLVVLSAAIAPALVIVRAQVDKTLEKARTNRDPGISDMQFKMPSSVARGNTTTRSTSYHLHSVDQPERKKARKNEAAVPLLSVNEDVEPRVEDEQEQEQEQDNL
ncbi:hypothetical protein V5O48_016408 [Marasmius crinis-equi]|uniref:Uncharacterized protein n=1 Tax=Marasmius crinis-equi TaxID=585013 RepID=A0ABR3ERT0_9AGAR